MRFKDASALLIAAGLGVLPFAQTASAQEVTLPDHPVMRDRFFISAGAMYARSNVTANLNSSTFGLGALIDFENDLGLDEYDFIGLYNFRWRITKRFQFEAEYFKLDRDNTKQLDKNIQWGNLNIPISAVATSRFDIDDFRLSIGYSFFRTQDKELGVGLGAHVMSMSASLTSANFGSQRATESAPLPFVNLYGRFALSDHWLFSVRVDRLSLSTGNIDGSVFSTGTDLVWQPWQHFAFGIGYREINLQVSSTDDKWRGEAQIQESGPYLFIATTF